jgi:hypothetical protein
MERMTKQQVHEIYGIEIDDISKREDKPMDVLKLISITEDALMASVSRRDGETAAKAFTRKYETDIEFRKDWATISEAKLTLAAYPDRMPTKPTEAATETEAYEQLMSMANEMRKTSPQLTIQQAFARVMSDPANRNWASAATSGR